ALDETSPRYRHRTLLDDRLLGIREAAVGALAAFDASYRLRGGIFTSGGSRLWSSLRCASVGSGSSKNTSHMIHAASGTRPGSFMSVPTQLCPLGGRLATRLTRAGASRRSWPDPNGYQ